MATKPIPVGTRLLALTGFGYEFRFSLILKHGYETDNSDICTYPEPIPKPVPNVENQFVILLYK